MAPWAFQSPAIQSRAPPSSYSTSPILPPVTTAFPSSSSDCSHVPVSPHLFSIFSSHSLGPLGLSITRCSESRTTLFILDIAHSSPGNYRLPQFLIRSQPCSRKSSAPDHRTHPQLSLHLLTPTTVTVTPATHRCSRDENHSDGSHAPFITG